MENSRLIRQLQAYEQWKDTLSQTIESYGTWLKKHKLDGEESQRQIKHCLNALEVDRLTIAFVAEFSRGKTELINSIFFSDYGRRLLPSTAGRTTMCPTELFFDRKSGLSYVRLLPIETRLDDRSLDELKRDTRLWANYPLDLQSPDQIEDCLQQVVQTRKVPVEEAVRLGMYDPDQHAHQKHPPQFIEIPRWRHAMISFPHPLLRKGLAILDTPGLNALGSEPELTLGMLPSAQAVLFVLAADTGVTRTDLEMWQNHIKGFHRSRKRGLMVVLNKVDTLWDDLHTEKEIQESVERQCKETARILGVEPQVIFPVSAQKGLLARVKGDQNLYQRSNMAPLEHYLSHEVLNARQEIIHDSITSEVSQMIENSRGLVTSRLNSIKTQLNELRDLSGKSQEVIEHMMAKTREEQANYMRNVNRFQASRKVLQEQALVLRQALDMERLEKSIEATRKRMTGNWTTAGLKQNMQALFSEMRDNMQTVVEQSEQSRKLIRSIYRRFQNEHGFTVMQPKMFSIMRYRVELELLHQEAEIFRKSPLTAMTEKHFVVKRFFMVMVSRARDIFYQARQEVDAWLKRALDPLVQQIREHKLHMERRLLDLKKVSRSRDTLEQRVAELQKQYNAIATQLTALRNMHNTLNSRPRSDGERHKPRLVSRAAGG